MAWLGEDARLAGMEAKQSLSDTVPFGRLRVRLKREIITLRMPALRPAEGRAPGVDAGTLKRWLDQGRDDAGREVVMLDTRNDYETDAGAFAQAVDYRIARFTDFLGANDLISAMVFNHEAKLLASMNANDPLFKREAFRPQPTIVVNYNQGRKEQTARKEGECCKCEIM